MQLFYKCISLLLVLNYIVLSSLVAMFDHVLILLAKPASLLPINTSHNISKTSFNPQFSYVVVVNSVL